MITKIGFLNERTGAYKYLPILEVTPDGYKLNGKAGKYDNFFVQPFDTIEKFTKEFSKDFPRKTLLKIR